MSLFSSLQVSASGMAAQRTRAELLVENMANAETTRTPEGGPYPPQRRGVFERTAEPRPSPPSFRTSSSTGVHGLRRGHRRPALRKCATCPAIPTPTPTATSRFRT